MSITCYHYCTDEFLKELEKKKVIKPSKYVPIEHPTRPSQVIMKKVFIDDNLNNGYGMFFAWEHPDYQGKVNVVSNSNIRLLELRVPEGEYIETNYREWCDYALDLFRGNNQTNGSYIFNVNNVQETQYLLRKIKYNWIRDIKVVETKYI